MMATLTMIQVARYAYQAGFRGQDLRVIVAIAQAESQFVTTAHNPGHAGDPENSYGLWQINLVAHPQVTAQQAMDPTFAAQYAYKLFSAAGGFTDWGTYNTGVYKQQSSWIFMQMVLLAGGAGLNLGNLTSNTWTIQQAEQLWPWLFPMILNYNDPHVFHWNPGKGENGTDFGMAMHTPITSLTSGTVVSTGYFGGGGVVCVASNLAWNNMGHAVVYYQHLDTIAVRKNQTVGIGTVIGLSGGQLSGGFHPATCCSTGPHIEVGINPPATQDGLWVSLGPNVDPWPFLSNLVQNGPSAHDVFATQAGFLNTVDQAVAGTGPVGDSFLAICADMDYAMGFIPIDWSTLSSGTSWWDYLLPWQWGYTASTITGNLAGAIWHDVQAFLYRALLVIIGLVIIIAWFAALLKSLSLQFPSQGGGDAGETGALAGAETAAVA